MENNGGKGSVEEESQALGAVAEGVEKDCDRSCCCCSCEVR